MAAAPKDSLSLRVSYDIHVTAKPASQIYLFDQLKWTGPSETIASSARAQVVDLKGSLDVGRFIFTIQKEQKLIILNQNSGLVLTVF